MIRTFVLSAMLTPLVVERSLRATILDVRPAE